MSKPINKAHAAYLIRLDTRGTRYQVYLLYDDSLHLYRERTFHLSTCFPDPINIAELLWKERKDLEIFLLTGNEPERL